jgi:hypothetical protein
MNIENKYLLLVQQIPDDLIRYIKKFIPLSTLVWLDKKTYFKNHHIIHKLIPTSKYESYVRDMIRKDNQLVTSCLMRENFKRWTSYKKYSYKNIIYQNFNYFLLDYCRENKSTNCSNIINEYLKDSRLSKNQHKKNIVRNIKWTN